MGALREKFSREIVENKNTHLPLEHPERIKKMIALIRLVLFGQERLTAHLKEMDDA
ncbi:MAG: hypothetical protein Q7S09_02320 [bacterium]|nr:hypothetical protein [bacterium]